MRRPMHPPGEIAQRGKKIYDEKLRGLLEPKENHKYIVIDVETGDYEIDPSHLAAFDRAIAKRPDAPLFATRIGHRALCRIGGQIRIVK